MKNKAAFLMLLAVAALVPARLAAQDTVDPRWLPWLGCWEPVENMAPSDVADGQVRQAYYCVRPAASGVEIATVVDGASVSSRTMIADGARHAVSEDGCNGWQMAQWSGDGQRLFVSSEVTCEGGVRRTASGLMAMISPMEWIDAHSVGLGDERVPGAIRYRPAPTSVEESAGFQNQTRYAVIADARRLAAAPLTIDDVAEVSEHVDGTALQAFLFERGQGFDLNADNLAALSNDGVPDDVIDLMVALSYPNKFTLDRASMEGEPMATEPGDRGAYDRYGYYGRDRYWDYCYGRGFYSYCSPYGYMPLGWSYGIYNPYSYGYGYGYGYGYRYNPVIIVSPNDGYTSPGGRAVKGQGYTRINRGSASGGGSISTGRTAVGRSGASSGSSRGSSSSGRTAVGRSGGSSGGSTARTSSGGSSSSGTSTGRTAKARTGGGGG